MDILVYLLILLSVVWLALYNKFRVKKRLYFYIGIALSILLLLLHLILGEVRWQLYSLYLGFALLLVLFLIDIVKTQLIKEPYRKVLRISAMIFILLSSLLLFAFPIYDLPEVSGSHPIGTQSFVIEDETRFEQYGMDDSQYRRFKIQIWYPAETIEGYEQVPWIEDGLTVTRALSKDTGLPSFALDHTNSILSNAYHQAPIKSSISRLPVVIISHGWRGFRNLHTDFAEELASQGYLVVSIDHTYGSVATVFAQDDVAYLNRNALPDRKTTPDFLDYAKQLVNTYADDVVATIDYLEDMNDLSSGSRFSDRINLDRIGLIGHSTGGGADVTVGLKDNRIDAVLGLDPWVEPISEADISQGLDIPSLFIRSEMWETGENNINLLNLVESSSYPSLLYQIDGTTHYDFTMVYMYSPLTKLIGFTGDVDGKYLNQMLEQIISDFFDMSLRDKTDQATDISQWEEINIVDID